MIDGVKIVTLRPRPDERGCVTEILRNDDPGFTGFGQAYTSTVNPGVVKAWHCHERQTDRIAVVVGMAKFVMFDDRLGSPTKGEVQELFIGRDNPVLVTVPPGVWHGMKACNGEAAMLLNIPTRPYDHAKPDELRKPAHSEWRFPTDGQAEGLEFCDNGIPYDWGAVDK